MISLCPLPFVPMAAFGELVVPVGVESGRATTSGATRRRRQPVVAGASDVSGLPPGSCRLRGRVNH